MKFVAARDKLPLPADVSVSGEVGIGAIPTALALKWTCASACRAWTATWRRR